jgi:hypothetical protein
MCAFAHIKGLDVEEKAFSELVLDSALTIFRRDGFHQASIDEIAEEAGFSRGAADPGWSLLMAEFAVHAARNPDVARRFREQDHVLREASTKLIAEICARDCVQCSEREANEVVTAMMAIGCGITLEQQVAPETINLEMMEDLFVAIAERVGAKPGVAG